ncbi:hypothetical protein BI330_02095 [Mycobacterium sp. CBMA 623]|nr:hypothetical protein [Mycobacteroides sp. CBMA 326]
MDHRVGLQWLNVDQTRLLRAVDGLVQDAGARLGSDEIIPPALLPVSTLDAFDCYENFPHLAFVATTLDTKSPGSLTAIDDQAASGEFAPTTLEAGLLGLPTAACWGIYAALANQQLPGNTLFSTVNRCFRAEDHYEPLRRVLGFHMREIVAVGSFDFCSAHTASFSARIVELCNALRFDVQVEPGLDPFFDKEAPRAVFSKISPVKYEFVVDGISIASINNHRTFFGVNSDIRVGADIANTSCVAFGLERWVSVLQSRGIVASDIKQLSSSF